MTANHPGVAHPTDGDLIRYLDFQLEDTERKGLIAHLSGCAECAERFRALGEQAEVVSGYLRRLDEDVRVDELARARALAAARQRRPARFGRLERIAAVAALAGIVTLGVEPVRAWMLDRLSVLTGQPEQVSEVRPAESPLVLERGSLVAFEPAGQTFVLELEHAQAAGEVRLEVRDAPGASAQIEGGSEETILVLPSGVRIENHSASTASYVLSLPSHLRLVQVFAGGVPVAIIPLEGEQIPWSRSVSLSAPSPR